MGIMIASSLDGKAAIEIHHVFGSKSVGRFHGRDLLQTEFLDKPILKGLVDPFDASFGLRRVGTDDFDVQGLHRLPELGHTGTRERILGIDFENAMLIAVESNRTSVSVKVTSGSGKVIEGGFDRNKEQFHQSSRRVVNVHK